MKHTSDWDDKAKRVLKLIEEDLIPLKVNGPLFDQSVCVSTKLTVVQE